MREGERADQFRIAAAFVLILEVEGRGEGRVYADYAAEIPEKSDRDLSSGPSNLLSRNETNVF